MYAKKFVGKSLELLCWDRPNSDADCFEQYCELRVGRTSLFVQLMSFGEPLSVDQCRRVLDFSGTYPGLNVTFFRRWYFVVELSRYRRGTEFPLGGPSAA